MPSHADLQRDIQRFADRLEALARSCSSIDEVHEAWKAGWRTLVGGTYDVDREWLDLELDRVQDRVFKDGILWARIAAGELAASGSSQAGPTRVRVPYRGCDIVACSKWSPPGGNWTVSIRLQDAHWPHRPWHEDRIAPLPDVTGFDSRQAATEYGITQAKASIDRALALLDDPNVAAIDEDAGEGPLFRMGT